MGKGQLLSMAARASAGALALIGGQEFSESSLDLNRTLLANSGASTVVLVTLAAAFENPDAVTRQATDHFATLGATVETVPIANRHEANDAQAGRALKGSKLIYISDGSAMHLRSALKDTALFDGLMAAHRAGATVAASGAGATVLSDPMIDPRGGAYTVGFALVEHLAAFTHYTSDADHLWQRASELLPHDATLVGIPDSVALVRSPDAQWSVAGGAVTARRGTAQRSVPAGPITLW